MLEFIVEALGVHQALSSLLEAQLRVRQDLVDGWTLLQVFREHDLDEVVYFIFKSLQLLNFVVDDFLF